MFRISHIIEEDICILVLSGRMVTHGAVDVKTYVNQILEQSSLHGFVMDLGGVTVIDSTGIGLLLSIFRSIRLHQAEVVLCNLSQKVQKYFNQAHLEKVISVYQSRSEALHELQEFYGK